MKQIRCKPGDLALVIYDIPDCIKNVGRLVHVRGPLALNRVYQLQCWLIQPVSAKVWYIDYYSEVRRCTNFSHCKLEHPDEWLLPLRPRGSELAVSGTRELIRGAASDALAQAVKKRRPRQAAKA